MAIPFHWVLVGLGLVGQDRLEPFVNFSQMDHHPIQQKQRS
jgi:hypothetical protein